MNNDLIFLIILGVGVFLFFYIRKNFKYPKTGCLILVDGGVKTGKSTLSVALVRRNYKSTHRRWKFRKFLCKVFSKPITEEPHIYSNIPLSCDFVPLTLDLILRKKRFTYGSIIYVNEASLLAESQMFRDMEVNERLMLFNKLIGHELKGGQIVYDTQAISDLHYSIKRCLSEYLYIHHLTKWIPFFLVAYVRECRYSEDNNVISVDTSDVEDTLKRVIIPKSVWKLFDAYAFSSLTDDLPVEENIVHGKDLPNLKVNKILSFKRFITVPDEFQHHQSNNKELNENEKTND